MMHHVADWHILLLPLGSSSLWDNLLAVNIVEAVVAGIDLPPA